MFDYLVSKIIRSHNFNNKRNRDKLIKLTGIMGLLINILLFAIKLISGMLVNSISMISDSINNLSDSLTSLVTIYGASLSSKPADEEHPYGHGRSEYLATLIVGLFVILVGFQLFISSIKEIFDPKPINSSIYTIVILIVSILLKLYMYLFNTKANKMADSLLNKSVAKDSLNDVFATSLVLISIIFIRIFDLNIDGYIGILISVIILKSGLDIFLEMGNILLGRQISKETMSKIRDIILHAKYIKGVHNIEIHEYGKNMLYGSCHVEAPANIDVYSMHKIINEVENEVYEKTGVDLNIHIDPSYLLDEDKFYSVEDKEDLENIDL